MDPNFPCFFKAITGALFLLYFSVCLLQSFTKCGPRTWINSLPWDLLIHAHSPAHPHVLKQKLWSGAQQSRFTKPSSSDAGAAEVRATAHLGSAQDHSDTSFSTIAKHKQTQTNDENPPFI